MEMFVESVLIETVNSENPDNESKLQKKQEIRKGIRRMILIIVGIILIISILSTLGLVELNFDWPSGEREKSVFNLIDSNSTSNISNFTV